MLTVRSDSPARTRELGAALASVLRPGDLVLLAGDLGAGKTCFVQGAAAALGVTVRVTSPTFIIARTYAGDVPVCHVDAYRLSSLAEMEDLDLDLPYAVTFIEWGGAVQDALPPDRLVVAIVSDGDDDDRRAITVTVHGDAWGARASELRAAMEA